MPRGFRGGFLRDTSNGVWGVGKPSARARSYWNHCTSGSITGISSIYREIGNVE